MTSGPIGETRSSLAHRESMAHPQRDADLAIIRYAALIRPVAQAFVYAVPAEKHESSPLSKTELFQRCKKGVEDAQRMLRSMPTLEPAQAEILGRLLSDSLRPLGDALHMQAHNRSKMGKLIALPPSSMEISRGEEPGYASAYRELIGQIKTFCESYLQRLDKECPDARLAGFNTNTGDLAAPADVVAILAGLQRPARQGWGASSGQRDPLKEILHLPHLPAVGAEAAVTHCCLAGRKTLENTLRSFIRDNPDSWSSTYVFFDTVTAIPTSLEANPREWFISELLADKGRREQLFGNFDKVPEHIRAAFEQVALERLSSEPDFLSPGEKTLLRDETFALRGLLEMTQLPYSERSAANALLQVAYRMQRQTTEPEKPPYPATKLGVPHADELYTVAEACIRTGHPSLGNEVAKLLPQIVRVDNHNSKVSEALLDFAVERGEVPVVQDSARIALLRRNADLLARAVEVISTKHGAQRERVCNLFLRTLAADLWTEPLEKAFSSALGYPPEQLTAAADFMSSLGSGNTLAHYLKVDVSGGNGETSNLQPAVKDRVDEVVQLGARVIAGRLAVPTTTPDLYPPVLATTSSTTTPYSASGINQRLTFIADNFDRLMDLCGENRHLRTAEQSDGMWAPQPRRAHPLLRAVEGPGGPPINTGFLGEVQHTSSLFTVWVDPYAKLLAEHVEHQGAFPAEYLATFVRKEVPIPLELAAGYARFIIAEHRGVSPTSEGLPLPSRDLVETFRASLESCAASNSTSQAGRGRWSLHASRNYPAEALVGVCSNGKAILSSDEKKLFAAAPQAFLAYLNLNRLGNSETAQKVTSEFLRAALERPDSAVEAATFLEALEKESAPTTTPEQMLTAAATTISLIRQGRGGSETWDLFSSLWSGDLSAAYSLDQRMAIFVKHIDTFGMVDAPILFSRLANAHGTPVERAEISALEQRTVQVVEALLQKRDGLPPTLQTPLDLELVQAVCRVHAASFNTHLSPSRLIQHFNRIASRLAHPALLDDLPRVELKVKKLAATDAKKTLATDALKLEALLVSTLAATVVDPQEALSSTLHGIVSQLRDDARALADRLKGAPPQDDKISQTTARKLQQLNELLSSLHDLETPADALLALARGEIDLKGPVRQGVLSLLAINSAMQLGAGIDKGLGDRSKSHSERAELLVAFGSHIFLEEGLKNLNLDPRERKRLESCVPIPLLKQEAARLAAGQSSESESIWAIPTRGLAGELSGYICDACWNGQQMALDRYSGLTPVVFVRNYGKPNASLVGATLMIPTFTANDEAAVVVRGFNPLHNALSTLDAGSFVEEYLDAITPALAERGYNLIAAPRDDVGASSTNRPAVGAHYDKTYAKPEMVELYDPSNSALSFNGYDIHGICFVLRRLTALSSEQLRD